MTTGTIIAIVVGAFILIALIGWVASRRGAAGQQRKLARLREQAAESEHAAADQRLREAERMEQQARVARANAEVHQERASLHQEGLADHELVNDDGAPREDLDHTSQRDSSVTGDPAASKEAEEAAGGR